MALSSSPRPLSRSFRAYTGVFFRGFKTSTRAALKFDENFIKFAEQVGPNSHPLFFNHITDCVCIHPDRTD